MTHSAEGVVKEGFAVGSMAYPERREKVAVLAAVTGCTGQQYWSDQLSWLPYHSCGRFSSDFQTGSCQSELAPRSQRACSSSPTAAWS